MDYKSKILKALILAEDFDQLDYIQEKINHTEQVNRRTKQGRELTDELLNLTQRRKIELAEVLPPF